MNIAFLECAQNFGGARKVSISIASNLKGSHNVYIIDLYGFCRPFINACEQKDLKIYVLSPSNPYLIQSATSRWMKIKNLLLFLPHMAIIGKKLKRLSAELELDYICVNTFRPMLALYMAKQSAKTVFFAHAWYIDSVIPRHEKFLLKRLPDKLVCVSEATRQALYNNRISTMENMLVVHNSICEHEISREIASLPKEKDDFVIFHNGGFTPGKGQLISVEIARELKRRGFPFKLVFAGIIYQETQSLTYYEAVVEKVKEYNLEDNVVFVVNKNSVYEYIRACDVLIHPSETEGFPLCVMEAQILKKPVIANPVGGVIDMVLDNYTGFLTDYNDVAQYCDCIIKLQKDRTLYETISGNAYALAKTCFSKERQMIQLNKVFTK